jgi:hypothetical protein
MRLGAYVRAYHAIAPLLAGLIVLATLYGGGVARAEEAYGVSAVVLFPVFAWQTKILLDVEPDVQRRLARVAAGSAHREIAAGLLAATATAVPTILLGLVLPWFVGGVKTGSPGSAAGIGVFAHVLSAVAGVALGAWASRPISRTVGVATGVLAGGAVLTIVLGLAFSPVPWLVPPLMATARAANRGLTVAGAAGLAAWALAWSAVVIAGYWRLRLRRT